MNMELATRDLKIIKRALKYTYSNHTIEDVEADNDLEWMSSLDTVIEETIKEREMEETKREVTVIVQSGVVAGVNGLDKDQRFQILEESEGEELEHELVEESIEENDNSYRLVTFLMYNGCLTDVINLKSDQCYVLYDLDGK